MIPPPEQIVLAIQHLHAHPTESQEVNRQLMELQRMPDAWSICLPLLEHPHDINVQFFGAQTLQVKIVNDWHSVGDKAEVKFMLMRLLLRTPSFHDVVMRKLCLALAAYALKTIPDEWPNFIQDTMSMILEHRRDPAHPEAFGRFMILLEFLQLVPEEVQRPEFSPERRVRIMTEMNESLRTVLDLLQACLNSPSDAMKVRALKCLVSWIHFEPPVLLLPPLINKTLELVANPAMFEAAMEVLQEFVVHPQSHHFETSICDGLLTKITTGWFRQQFDEAYTNEDELFIKPACRLLVAFGESYTNYLIRHFTTPPILSLMEMILKCTSYPGYYPADEEISDSTLHFWFILEDTLADNYLLAPSDGDDQDPYVPVSSSGIALSELGELRGTRNNIVMSTESIEHFEISVSSSTEALPELDASSGEIQGKSRAELEVVKKLADDIFIQLIRVLRQKVRYPSDIAFQRWNSDMKSKFRTFRRDCADTLRYVHNFISTRAFATLNETLLDQLNRYESGARDESFLLDIEATIFSLRALAESMTTQDEVILPVLIELILNRVPRDQHPRLTQTILAFFGSIAESLGKSNNSAMIMALIDLILPFMRQPASPTSPDNPDISYVAFRSFNDIYKSCASHLAPSLPAVMQMFMDESNHINPKQRLYLVESISGVIQAMPIQEQSVPLEQLINHIASRLRLIVGQTANLGVDPTGVTKEVCDIIGYLTSIIRDIQIDRGCFDESASVSLQDRQLFLSIMQSIVNATWERVMEVRTFFPNNPDIRQSVLSYMDVNLDMFKASSDLGSSASSHLSLSEHPLYINPALSLQYLDGFTNLIVDQFQASPVVEWVDLAGSVILIFGPVSQIYVPDVNAYLTKYQGLSRDHFVMTERVIVSLKRLLACVLEVSTACLFADGPNSIFGADGSIVQVPVVAALSKRMDCQPDFVDSLLRVFELSVRKSSSIIMDMSLTQHVAQLLTFMIAGLHIEERTSFRTSMQLWVSLLDAVDDYETPTPEFLSNSLAPFVNRPLKSIVVPLLGHRLVFDLMQGIAVEYPRSYNAMACDVIFKAIVRFPKVSRIWCRIGLGLQGDWPCRVSQYVSAADREVILKKLLTTRNIRKFKEVMKEVTAKCRGLEGTLYGSI